MRDFFDKVEQRVVKEENQCDCNSELKLNNRISLLKRRALPT
jgi:hypothetical protein